MKRALSIILLIVSLLSYFFAPKTYSFDYCFWLHNLFIVSATMVFILDVRNEKVGFNLLFSISFFFTNFVYPVYIYPVDPYYSLFSFPFNEKVITKCTALAQVAYSMYTCGYLWRNKTENTSKRLNFDMAIGAKQMSTITLLIIIYFLVFLSFGGLDYFEDRYVRGEMSSNMKVQYLMLFFPSIIIFFASTIFLSKNRKHIVQTYIILSIIALILLSSGTRTFPLIIFSTISIIYCLRNKVSISLVIPGIIFGILLMSFIGNIRHDGILSSNMIVKESSELGALDYFEDLFINNRNLYVFYDFVEKYSCTYGLTMVSSLLAPIPFAQTLFLIITGIPHYFLSSASLSTFLELGDPPSFGLGTNIVGDVYLAFGFIGILILFFALGRFVIYARKRMLNGSYAYLIVYLSLASDAIFMCRASFLDALKIILWTLLFAWILKRTNTKKSRTQL